MTTTGTGTVSGGMLPFHVGFSESSAPSQSNWNSVKRNLLKVKTVRQEVAKKVKVNHVDEEYIFKWNGRSEAEGTGPFVDFLAGKLADDVSVSSVIGDAGFLNCTVPGVSFSGTTDLIIYPSTGQSGPEDLLGCVELKTGSVASESTRLQAEKELLAALSFGGYDKFVALTNGNEWLFYTHSDTLVESDEGPKTRLLEERGFVGKEGIDTLNAHVSRVMELGKINMSGVGMDEGGGGDDDDDKEKDDNKAPSHDSQGDGEHKSVGGAGSPKTRDAHFCHQHISGEEVDQEDEAFDADYDRVVWDEETRTVLVTF
jgi:hypothetical protein